MTHSTTSLDLLHCLCTIDTSSAHVTIIWDPRRHSWAPDTPDLGRPGLKQVLTTNGPTLLSPPYHSQREMKRPSSCTYCWWEVQSYEPHPSRPSQEHLHNGSSVWPLKRSLGSLEPRSHLPLTSQALLLNKRSMP